MKTSCLVCTLLGLTVLATHAQFATMPTNGNPLTVPAPTAFQVVERGENHRVWQKESYNQAPDGTIITNIQSYTDLATGMHYKNSQGQWVESKELIESHPRGAIARQGQYQVIFANNLNSIGAIDQNTPDGKRLQSNILGLGYYDSATGNTVMIAMLQNSQGELVSSNQVLYPNAFHGVTADVCYTYKKGSFEQDVILREQPPTPESFGLNSATTVLEVMTEFINPPAAKVTKIGVQKSDEYVDWGVMRMSCGKAFDIKARQNKKLNTYVSKQYVTIDSRHILVEKIKMPDIQSALANLPPQASAVSTLPVIAKQKIDLPHLPLAQAVNTPMNLASRTISDKGFVLDYVEIVADQLDYTFKSDTTYHVMGEYNMMGNIIFEGGTVIKYDYGAGELDIYPNNYPETNVKWLGSAYRPVILTAVDDDSVGEQIDESTGSPSGNYYGWCYIWSNLDVPFPTISNFRVCYASCGFLVQYPDFTDGQFINCYNGIQFNNWGANYHLKNILFANMGGECLPSINGQYISFQNVTFVNDASPLADFAGYQSPLEFVNCIFANVDTPFDGREQAWGNNNGFYNSPAFGDSSFTITSYPFQRVGAGNYYLTNGCGFQSVGTTNIDITLLTDLKNKTTYPPIVYTNLTITTNLTLIPQVVRETNNCLDLGYHYDPIDYLCGAVYVTNATITVTPGTVIAGCDPGRVGYSLMFDTGAQFICQGQPNNLNRIVEYSTVQEGPPDANWDLYFLNPSAYMLIRDNFRSTVGPTIICRFTDWSCIWHDVYHLYAGYYDNNVNIQDCQFHGGWLANGSHATLNISNCLLDRVHLIIAPDSNNVPIIRNITMYGGLFSLFVSDNSTNIIIKDSLFDGVSVPMKYYSNICYNAYVTNSSVGYGGFSLHTGDLLYNTSPVYKSGPLGKYYLPTSSPLINAGSTTADQVGLYHFTTQTNQVKETNSVVDIGYHYMATDAYGNPLDSNGNGIPDYIEDTSGNGQSLTITLLTPTNNAYYSEPATIPIQATVFDWRSVVTNVSFSRSSTQITTVTNAPFQYNWPVVAAGSYSLTATARDMAGTTATSASVTVTITNLCGY